MYQVLGVSSFKNLQLTFSEGKYRPREKIGDARVASPRVGRAGFSGYRLLALSCGKLCVFRMWRIAMCFLGDAILCVLACLKF